MTDHDCSCAACREGLTPFTVEHFERWAYELRLDNGRHWRVETFQTDFAGDLFAFSREMVPAECWLIIPEGNGKSTLVSGLALYYLEHFPMAAIPVAAKSREQAETIYRQAEIFIVGAPRLHELVPNLFEQAKGKKEMDVPRFEAQEGYRRIKFNVGGVIQIRAADENTQDGIIPRGLMIMDELHRASSLGLYRLWSGKGEKLETPIAVISTAGEPGSEFEELRESMRQGDDVARSGCHTCSKSEAAVLHEWSVPEDGDVEDLDLVAAANPLSTITVAKLQRKRNKKSWNLAHWRRFTCNLPTRSETAAITEAEWANAITEEPFPTGEPKWLGLDVAWKWDTTALVPMIVRDKEHRLFGAATILEPPRDGSSLDSHKVEAALLEEHERGPIHTVVMDTSKAEQLAQWIEETLGATVVDRQQTNPLAAIDYERLTEALRHSWLWHSGDKGLTRHVLNAIAKTLPGGKTRFERPAQSRGGSTELARSRWIDAMTAASMVHGYAIGELFGDEEEEQAPLIAFS